jgi:hypothetical protein
MHGLDLSPFVWKGGAAAIAADIEGDSLPDLARGQGIAQDRPIRVGMNVDEAGSHDQAGCINDLRCRRSFQVSNSPDGFAHDSHITDEGLRAGSIDDPPVPDQQIEFTPGRAGYVQHGSRKSSAPGRQGFLEK